MPSYNTALADVLGGYFCFFATKPSPQITFYLLTVEGSNRRVMSECTVEAVERKLFFREIYSLFDPRGERWQHCALCRCMNYFPALILRAE